MKAADYAQIIARQSELGENAADIATDILSQLGDETSELVRTRKAKCNSAMVAIFKEMNQKWQAILKHSPGFYSQFTKGKAEILYWESIRCFWPKIYELLERDGVIQ